MRELRGLLSSPLSVLSWILGRRSTPDVLSVAAGYRRIAKELTESGSVLVYLLDALRGDAERTLLVDMCSGKRPLLSLLWVYNTRGRAIAVDLEPPVPSLHEAQPERLTYLRADIQDPLTQTVIKSLVDKAKNDRIERVVVAGIHCCKTLSLRVVETAHAVNADDVVLVPCCWPSGVAESYDDWVSLLEHYLSLYGYRVTESTRVPSIMSERNHLIHATRVG